MGRELGHIRFGIVDVLQCGIVCAVPLVKRGLERLCPSVVVLLIVIVSLVCLSEYLVRKVIVVLVAFRIRGEWIIGYDLYLIHHDLDVREFLVALVDDVLVVFPALYIAFRLGLLGHQVVDIFLRDLLHLSG